jgi:hypothetical protein
VKRLLVVVTAVLGGLAVGAIWTWLQDDRFRADARVLVRPSSPRVVPAVEALAESSLVEANVAQTLHLRSLPRISAYAGKGGIVTVSVEAGSRERARQIDAEAVVILMQKVEQRFGTAAGVTTTVLDPAHAAEQTSPTPRRNLLVTGLIGLVAGTAAALMVPRGRPTAAEPDPRAEALRGRIGVVAKRELTLARRAGQLAAREQDLQRGEEKAAAAAARSSSAEQAVSRREEELEQQRREVERRLDERERALEERAAELEEREAQHEAAAEPEPEPEAEPVLRRPSGRWTLHELEALVQERSDAGADRDQQAEWATYLFLLREHAGADGALPSSLDRLVNDVFGPLPQRGE